MNGAGELPARPTALVLQHQHREQRKTGAADHHQMRWAPKGYVLSEDPVPDVVERKPDHRVHPAARHQHAADRRIPVARDAHRRRTGLVERQHDRQHARDEDAEQADDDEVVRRVGQRAGVAAVADVPADIPDEPEQGADDRRGEDQDRQRHPGRPVEFAPIQSATRASHSIRWVRWPCPTHSITTVITTAAIDRPITWFSPAPRADGSAANVSASESTCCIAMSSLLRRTAPGP